MWSDAGSCTRENVDTCCTNSHTLRHLSWHWVHLWKHTSYTILHPCVLKHNTCSALHVIHRGCLVLVCVTLQSRYCKVSRSTSDIEVLSWGSLWNGMAEGRIRREIWGDKGEAGESERRLRNQIFTSEHVISGKGDCNGNHSPLAWRQVCIQCIEWDISSVPP